MAEEGAATDPDQVEPDGVDPDWLVVRVRLEPGDDEESAGASVERLDLAEDDL